MTWLLFILILALWENRSDTAESSHSLPAVAPDVNTLYPHGTCVKTKKLTMVQLNIRLH